MIRQKMRIDLFSIKRRPLPALAVAGALTVVAVAGKKGLGLTWHQPLDASVATQTGLVILVLLGSDAVGYATLSTIFGESYTAGYDRFIHYFGEQSPEAMVVGGLLAAAEELFFRGLLLAGLVAVGLPAWAAVVLTALAFGLSHSVPEWPLSAFAAWAAWEGLLLGTTFVLTGSLVVVALAHGIHDVAGFGIFAHQRESTALAV